MSNTDGNGARQQDRTPRKILKALPWPGIISWTLASVAVLAYTYFTVSVERRGDTLYLSQPSHAKYIAVIVFLGVAAAVWLAIWWWQNHDWDHNTRDPQVKP